MDLTRLLPYEILRDILRYVSFIPRESDLGATSPFFDVFRSWTNRHIQAWKDLLPLRIDTTCVCRRWRAVALEFLYASFHDTQDERKFALFASVLSSYPYYGTLVRRLTIRLVNNPEKNALVTGILRRCPNLLSLKVIGNRHGLCGAVLSDPSILPTSLKEFDASASLSVSSLSALLAYLPQLEILLLYDTGGRSPETNYTNNVHPNLRNLRALQLVFPTYTSQSISRLIFSLELSR